MIRRPRRRAAIRPSFPLHFLAGVQHFNAQEFWLAHESWETLWLVAETDMDEFLQGLIQLAAAYHHLQRGTFRGAVRLFDAAMRRLDRFPEEFCGIDRQGAEQAARMHRQWTADLLTHGEDHRRIGAEEYPRLLVLASERAPMPVNEWW